jgi:hypothetical protein
MKKGNWADEIEATTVNSDGTLAAWTSITAGPQQIGANVYHAAVVVSPLLHPTSTGVLAPPGQPLSNAVYYNNAP